MISVQVICDMALWNFQISSIIPLKHEDTKIIKTYLIFKAYVCLIQTKVYIHIQNIKSPLNVYSWRHVAQKDVYV